MVEYMLTFMSVGHVACGQIHLVLTKCDYIQGNWDYFLLCGSLNNYAEKVSYSS